MDYLKLAEAKKDEVIKSVSDWVKINSVYDEKTVDEQNPFGKGVSKALSYIYEKALDDGFDAQYIDGYVTEINYGKGDEFVLVVGHADVVPIGTGWDHEPFGGEVSDGCLWGRGSSDDKGPVIASYYALKIIKELNIPLKRRIRIVVGGNEESGSRCLDYYFNTYKAPHPAYGFTPDADFPLIYGEKGILDYKYSGDIDDTDIEYIDGGVAFNSVPEKAVIRFKRDMHLEEAYKAFLARHNFNGEYSVEDGKTVLRFIGKAAHGSTPEEGINALTILMKFVGDNSNSEICKHFGKKLSCYEGKNIGIAFTGTKMGSLTMNVGVGHYEKGHYEYTLNIRYPIDIDFENMVKTLDANILHKGEVVDNDKPLYVDKESKFIKTLLSAYQEITGDYKSQPMTIGGGTYAKHANNTVAFGMDFPRPNNDHGRIHSPNEYIYVDSLVKGVAIYTKALVDLANL